LSGPATRRIVEREVELFGRQEYARLATISVAHLYSLRHRERRLNYIKTRPTKGSIGERRKLEPQGSRSPHATSFLSFRSGLGSSRPSGSFRQGQNGKTKYKWGRIK
jgi:hypothetical protein